MDREIEKVKKEYEEKQRLKKEKRKQKDKEKDKDAKKKDEEEDKEDEKEKDEKVRCFASQSAFNLRFSPATPLYCPPFRVGCKGSLSRCQPRIILVPRHGGSLLLGRMDC